MRLFIACSGQNRQCDLDTFFKHENHPWPPSLSQYGAVYTGTKSEIMGPLMSMIQSNPHKIPAIDVAILDGAVIVHILKPGTSKTFEDYAHNMFIPYICRLDVVCDKYVPNSLKATTRETRGQGKRTKVTLATRIPRNWPVFL
jgi:hypothetical protein